MTLWLEVLEETLRLRLDEDIEILLWLEGEEGATTLWLGEMVEVLALSLPDEEDAQEGLGIFIEYELSDVEAKELETTLAVLDAVELSLVTIEDERLL
jgi:hypothetical protein